MKNSGLFVEHGKKVFLFGLFRFHVFVVCFCVFGKVAKVSKMLVFPRLLGAFGGWHILVYLGLEGFGVFVFLVLFFFCLGFVFVYFALFVFCCWIVFGVLLVFVLGFIIFCFSVLFLFVFVCPCLFCFVCVGVFSLCLFSCCIFLVCFCLVRVFVGLV